MTLQLGDGTLTATLWPVKDPKPKSNGLFLELDLATPHSSICCAACDSHDPLRHVMGLSDGSLYVFLLKKNRVMMIAKVTNAVTAVAFDAEATRRERLYAAAGQSLFVVNVDSCRIEGKVVSPHFNAIVRIASHASAPEALLTVSVDCIAVWSVSTIPLTCRRNSRESLQSKVTSRSFVDARFHPQGNIISAESNGVITIWTPKELQPIKSVTIAGLGRSVSSLCVSSQYAMVGDGTSTEIVVLDSLSLQGVSAVSIPGSAVVKRVAMIGDGHLFVIQTSDSRVWFVNPASGAYQVTFTLAMSSLSSLVACDFSGATYCLIATSRKVILYHLPTVKAAYTSRPAVHTGSEKSSSSLLPFVRTTSDPQPDLPSDNATAASYEVPLPRGPVDVGPSAPSEWVKANLIEGASAGKIAPKTILLTDAVKQLYSMDAGNSSRGATRGSSQGDVTKQSVGIRTVAAENRRRTKPTDSPSRATSTLQTVVTSAGRSAVISARSFLDSESRQVNMEKLRVMLMRYGMYPEKYRTLIWRFLLQLPDKKYVAPQFAALSEKGPHPAVETLLQPFPLPRNKQRALLEAALSALAWNSPVLSVAHFVPMILFPFAELYGSDTQSAVEVVLSVLINWGREFFAYYPHHPVAILSYLNHTLKVEDVTLWNHLEDCGVGVDIWGWQIMVPFYTEIFTRNEWLQVMDHAFSNEPIWLFLFHVRWVIQIRDMLLQLHDHSQLVAMFRKASPVNLNQVIQQTYRLRHRCVTDGVAAPYLKFDTFKDYAYPVMLECDPSVITSRVRELERIAELQNDAKKSKSLVDDVQKRMLQAAILEDAFIGKQRAMVAAKLESANETWVQEVQLEKERQRLRDIEHETRLLAIQEQLRSAQRLEALQMEVNAASQSARDAEVDRKREITKWDFSDRMTAQEMERLEAGARLKLTSIMKTTTTLSEIPHGLEAEPAAAPNVIAMAHKEKAISPIVPDSLVEAVVAECRSPPPPRIPVVAPIAVPVTEDATQTLLDGHEKRDSQTMTELPPLPPTAPSSRSESSCAKPNSESMVPIPNIERRAPSESTDDTSAPVTSSTCESDPIEYYRRLQESIRVGVEAAKREQQEQLRALRSRFGQQVVQDDGSDVTEELVDDNATTIATESSAEYYHRHHHTAGGGDYSQRRRHHVLEDNMLCDDDNEVSREIRGALHQPSGTGTLPQRQATSSIGTSSRGSTTMTEAIRKPRRDVW